MMKQFRFVFILFLFFIFGCQANAPNESSEKTKTNSPPSSDPTDITISSTRSVTVTPSRMPSQTLTSSPTPPTPATDVEGNPICVVLDPEVSIDTEIFTNPEFQDDIANYLNAGGDPAALPSQLAADPSAQDPNLIAVYQPDLNADQIPDVLVTITLPYSEGSGETHVLAFVCQNGEFNHDVLFRRAGAGSRAEGLYAGGGAQVEGFEDLNKTGNIEILFSVNWPTWAHYFLITWEDDQFYSLISYMDELGFQRSYFEVNQGDFSLEDVNDDGIYELLVIDINSQTMEAQTWYWNGEGYRLADD